MNRNNNEKFTEHTVQKPQSQKTVFYRQWKSKIKIKIFLTFTTAFTSGLEWFICTARWIQSTPLQSVSFKPHSNTILSSTHFPPNNAFSLLCSWIKICYDILSSPACFTPSSWTLWFSSPHKNNQRRAKTIKFLITHFSHPLVTFSLSLSLSPCIPAWSNILFQSLLSHTLDLYFWRISNCRPTKD